MKQQKNKLTTDEISNHGTTVHETTQEPITWHAHLWRFISPEWMTRDMNLLLFARVFMSSTRALAGIVVPIYLAVLGFQGLMLGILFTVTALVSAFLSTAIGLLSDRIGRKPFLIIMPFLTAIASLAFALSHVVGVLFLFAALGSFGRGAGAGAGMIGPYQPAEQAFLADKVSSRYRNDLFGRVGFASSLGALIGGGPLIALAVLLSFGHTQAQYRIDFIMGAVFALIAGLLAIPLHEEHQPVAQVQKKNEVGAKQKRSRIRLSALSWQMLVRLWITNGINGLAVGFFGPFITYWYYRRYGVGPVEIGLLYSIINVAAMVVNLTSARVAARIGLVRTIVFTRVFQAVLIIPMVLAPTFWLAGGIYLIRMMIQRLGLPLRQSYVMGVVPNEERGRVGALANLPAQATSALSPTLAGYLFDHIALALPFEIGAVLQGANAALFFLFFRHIQPPEERSKSKPTTDIVAQTNGS